MSKPPVFIYGTSPAPALPCAVIPLPTRSHPGGDLEVFDLLSYPGLSPSGHTGNLTAHGAKLFSGKQKAPESRSSPGRDCHDTKIPNPGVAKQVQRLLSGALGPAPNADQIRGAPFYCPVSHVPDTADTAGHFPRDFLRALFIPVPKPDELPLILERPIEFEL